MKEKKMDNILMFLYGLTVAAIMLGSQIKVFYAIFPIFAIVAIILKKMYIKPKALYIQHRMIYSYKNSILFFNIWFIWAIMSLLWAQDKQRGLYQLKFFALGLICGFFCFSVIQSSEDIYKIMKVISISVVVNNLIAWHDIIWARYYFLQDSIKRQDYQDAGLPLGLFENTNDLATYLAFMCFIMTAVFLIEKKKIEKTYYALLAGSSILLLLKTGSKANLIGMLLAVMILIICHLYKRKVIALLASTGIFASVFVLVNIDNLNEIIQTLKATLLHTYRGPTSSYSIRINLILNAFISIKETFGIGVGVGNSQYYMRTQGTYETYGTFALHNFWLELFSEYGVIMGGLFLLFYVGLIFTFLHNMRFSIEKKDKIVSACFLCCLVQFVFGSLSSSSVMTASWLWVTFSLFVVHQRNLHKGRQ